MRVLRKFFVELILAALLVGWMLFKFPEILDPFMPWVLWAILWHLTWEIFIDRETAKKRVASLIGRRRLMAWIIAFVLGGLTSICYVYLSRRAISGIAEYARTHRNDKPGESKQGSASAAPSVEPNITLGAYLQPKQPYPDGILLGGISWSNHYVDVRLDIANGPVKIDDLDFSVKLDTDIAGVGQISQFQGVTAFPDKEPPPTWLEGTDPATRKHQSIPIIAGTGMMRSAPVYRVHCSGVLPNTTIHLVIASIAFNPPTTSGALPQNLFAPWRAPKEIRIKGRYAVQEGNSLRRYPLEFSLVFSQTPSHGPIAERRPRSIRHFHSAAKSTIGSAPKGGE